MAVGRYDTRRGLVVQEANALGTAYPRASLLPDSHQPPVKDLLPRYVDLRLKYWPCITTSYGGGAEGARSKLDSVFLPVLIAVVIVLIFDISHPRVGLIKIGQDPLSTANNPSRPTGPSLDDNENHTHRGY